MTLLDLIVLGLATWRLSSLLALEDGPYAIFARLRHWAGIEYGPRSEILYKNQFAEMLGCVYCNSVWLGAIWAVLYYLHPPTVWIALPFSLSAIAVIIQELLPE